MGSDFVFPEDVGTGAADGDHADAANFAAHEHTRQQTDFVETGLDLDVDWSANQFTLGEGMLKVSDESAEEAQSAEVRDQGVTYTVIVEERTDVAFSGDENVYVDVDLSEDDTVSIVTASEAPNDPSLLIAVLDSGDERIHHVNRGPDTRTESSSVRSTVPPETGYTIPENYAALVEEEYDVDGEVDVEGTLLPVSHRPTPKRHDHGGLPLRPRTSTVKRHVEEWEDDVYIEEENAQMVGGEYRVDGTIEADGALTALERIEADEIRVGENGVIRVL